MDDYIIHSMQKLHYTVIFNLDNIFDVYCYPGSVTLITVPQWSLINDIRHYVRSKASSIVKQLKYYEKFFPRRSLFRYVEGEMHLYLGRRYALSFYKDQVMEFKVCNGQFQFGTNVQKKRDIISRLIDEWYLYSGKSYFAEKMQNAMIDCGIPYNSRPIMQLSKIRGYFCNALNRSFIFSAYMMQMPPKCVDYIIYHAICHMAVCDHGSAFYDELIRLMPVHLNEFFRLKRS